MHTYRRVLPALAMAALCLTVASGPSAAVAVRPAASPLLRAPTPNGRTARVSGVTMIDSYNWAGYAQSDADGTFTGVTDTWNVPTLDTSLPGEQWAADWVGIGGFNDGTLVQAGTEAVSVDGFPLYLAWTEVLPSPEDALSLRIQPGDTIQTTVQEVKSGVWQMTVADLTTGKGKHRRAHYSGSTEASVEAIHERPCIADGCTSVDDLAELADTNNVTFDPGEFSTSPRGANMTNPLLVPAPGATVNQISMLGNDGSTVIASPSSPDSDGDGFTVAYGASAPPPPPS